MDKIPRQFDLPQLASHAGVSIRTVRYYIQQGLLPSPDARGPGAHYTEEHLERLQLIKRLQREHLPLAEIRRILENWSSEGERWGTPATPKSAKDYIQSVLGQTRSVKWVVGRQPKPREEGSDVVASNADVIYEQGPAYSPAQSELLSQDILPPQSANPKPHKQPTRSQWERVSLAPDIELHIRRPLSRELNKKLGELLEAAREILKEEE